MTPTLNKILATGLLLLGSATAFRLGAADKPDLERQTPVPAGETIPVMDFFRPPLVQQPILNPSGTHIAAIVAAGEDHTSLMVYDLKTQKMEVQTTRGDSDIDRVTWLNDNRLAWSISIKKMASFILCAGEVGALYHSYPLLQNVGATLIAVPPKDRLHPLARLSRLTLNTGKYDEVVTVDAMVATGKLLDLSGDGALVDQKQLDDTAEVNVRHIARRLPTLETPEGFNLDFIADKEGRLAFGTTSKNGIYTLHRLEGDRWEKCPVDLEEIKIIGAGDNPGEIVVLGQRQEGKPRALEVMLAATGKVVDVLWQEKTYDVDGWLYRDPLSRNIVGTVFNRAGPAVVWFSEAYRNLQKLADGLFPGQIVRIIGNDEQGKMVLISTFTDRQPPIYSWINLETRQAGLIKNSTPWIDPKRMQPMSAIKFKTGDGRQLDAFVTMPAGATKQNPPPLVVLVNNRWRDVWGYNEEVQFLASRGYAVLQPNYRGSAGTTGMFPTEDEWAFRKMHEDVTAATKTLVASGLVDPKRVAIMGTSFGGFLALSGAAYEPSLYRCAIALSPVVDWAKLIEDNKYNQYVDAFYSRMVFKLGDPKQDPQKFDAISPLRHASQIRAAVLISMGEYDDPVTKSGAKELASTVERNHIPAETMSFLNEAGGVHHLRNKIEVYSRIEAFLAKNMTP